MDIVVGTPGRVLDHLRRKSLNLKTIKYFILDEADEMLNMGFIDDINLILKETNTSKRILLFSATIPNEIKKIINKYMSNYETVIIESTQNNIAKINHQYLVINQRNKFNALRYIIKTNKDFYGFVFCNTKRSVDDVTKKLLDEKYHADKMYGNFPQNRRERILSKFRKKRITILVATDVAARGIDINNLTHVINYHFPQQLESYVHRVGRTGRAGKQGTAITLISESERRTIKRLERIINTPLKEIGSDDSIHTKAISKTTHRSNDSTKARTSRTTHGTNDSTKSRTSRTTHGTNDSTKSRTPQKTHKTNDSTKSQTSRTTHGTNDSAKSRTSRTTHGANDSTKSRTSRTTHGTNDSTKPKTSRKFTTTKKTKTSTDTKKSKHPSNGKKPKFSSKPKKLQNFSKRTFK